MHIASIDEFEATSLTVEQLEALPEFSVIRVEQLHESGTVDSWHALLTDGDGGAVSGNAELLSRSRIARFVEGWKHTLRGQKYQPVRFTVLTRPDQTPAQAWTAAIDRVRASGDMVVANGSAIHSVPGYRLDYINDANPYA